MRELRGRIDEADNARIRMGEDLSKQIADINFRLGGTRPATRPRRAAGRRPPRPRRRRGGPGGAAAAARRRRPPELALQEGNAALARRDYAAAEAAAREVLAVPRSPARRRRRLPARPGAGRQADWAQAAVAYDDAYKPRETGAHAQDSLLGLADRADQPQRQAGRPARRSTSCAPNSPPRARTCASRSPRARAARRVPLKPRSTGDEFAALMAPLGPFEPAQRLAVAVSGGADSLALALLARDWARGARRRGAAPWWSITGCARNRPPRPPPRCDRLAGARHGGANCSR